MPAPMDPIIRGSAGGAVTITSGDSVSGFTWVNPISDWGPIGNLGYYIHKGRVYWQGGIGADLPDGDYPSAFLNLPPEIRPATTIEFTAWGDFTNMDDAQPPSVLMQVDPSGVMSFVDTVPRQPGLTFAGYVFHGLSWDLSTATLDAPSWTDLGPFLASSGEADDPFQIDSEIAAHGSRLHLRGHVGIPNLGPETPSASQNILSALSTAGHREWSPQGVDNGAFPQQIGNDLLTLHLPFTGGVRPVQSYAEKGFGDSVVLSTQTWAVRRTIHLSIPTSGVLETVNSNWTTPSYFPASIGGFYRIAGGGYEIEEPTSVAVVGSWLMPTTLGDFGLDPADPSEQVGLWIGLLSASGAPPYFYKAVYTRQDHFHWLTLWAFDSGAPDGVGDGLRYRKVYETAHDDLSATPGPQTVVVGGSTYYLIRGNLSLSKSEDVPEASGSAYDNKIAFGLGPTYFSGGFPGWSLDDGGTDGTANATMSNLRFAGAPEWSAGRLEGTSGEGGTYWFGAWRASVGGGRVPSDLNPYAEPGSSWVLDGHGWFRGGDGEAGTITTGDQQAGIVTWPRT